MDYPFLYRLYRLKVSHCDSYQATYWSMTESECKHPVSGFCGHYLATQYSCTKWIGSLCTVNMQYLNAAWTREHWPKAFPSHRFPLQDMILLLFEFETQCEWRCFILPVAAKSIQVIFAAEVSAYFAVQPGRPMLQLRFQMIWLH